MTAQIVISFQSYWFVGTGREAGVYADSIPVKKKLSPKHKDLVPCVPGKTVKGMFRDAFITATRNGWFKDNPSREHLEEYLFGTPGPDKHNNKESDKNKTENKEPGIFGAPGILHFSTLEISDAVRAWLCENPQAVSELFRTVKSTAIDAATGTARNKSLREYEVVVPLTLTGELSFEEKEIQELNFKDSKDFIARLNEVASLITELGGKRTRGFGQCIITVKEA